MRQNEKLKDGFVNHTADYQLRKRTLYKGKEGK